MQKMVRTEQRSPQRTMHFIQQALLLLGAVTTGLLDIATLLFADQQQRERDRIERTRILLTPPQSLSYTIAVDENQGENQGIGLGGHSTFEEPPFVCVPVDSLSLSTPRTPSK
jgi:hypothetical protein